MEIADGALALELARIVESMDREILITLTPAQATCVIAHLQVALRHPHNVGASSIVARSVAETLIGAFPPEGRALLDRGFHSEFDVPCGAGTPPATRSWIDRVTRPTGGEGG